jgi:hypothetical protein
VLLEASRAQLSKARQRARLLLYDRAHLSPSLWQQGVHDSRPAAASMTLAAPLLPAARLLPLRACCLRMIHPSRALGSEQHQLMTACAAPVLTLHLRAAEGRCCSLASAPVAALRPLAHRRGSSLPSADGCSAAASDTAALSDLTSC